MDCIARSFSIKSIGRGIVEEDACALYDAPFVRGLVSFDCSVDLDWKKHFIDFLGSMPPAAVPLAERRQMIPRRVFVDTSGAVVSQQPKTQDLSEVRQAAEVEQIFESVVSNGLGLWVPFARNVVLPVGPTKYTIEKINSGYKLHMNGPGVEATLLIDQQMYLTSAVSRLPNPVRFATEFKPGPDGLLVSSVKTGSTTGASASGEAKFTFTSNS